MIEKYQNDKESLEKSLKKIKKFLINSRSYKRKTTQKVTETKNYLEAVRTGMKGALAEMSLEGIRKLPVNQN